MRVHTENTKQVNVYNLYFDGAYQFQEVYATLITEICIAETTLKIN